MKFVYIDGMNYDGYSQAEVEECRAKTMTVAELIEALSKCDPDAKVLFGNNYDDYVIETVDQI